MNADKHFWCYPCSSVFICGHFFCAGTIPQFWTLRPRFEPPRLQDFSLNPAFPAAHCLLITSAREVYPWRRRNAFGRLFAACPRWNIWWSVWSQAEKFTIFWAASLAPALDEEVVQFFRSKEILRLRERDARTPDQGHLVVEERHRLSRHREEIRRRLR